MWIAYSLTITSRGRRREPPRFPIALAAYLESAVVDTLIALAASVNQEDSQGHRPLAYAMRDSTGGLVSRSFGSPRGPQPAYRLLSAADGCGSWQYPPCHSFALLPSLP